MQGLLSLQVFGVPAQMPLEQISFVVQRLPSSHKAVLFCWTQPSVGLQTAVVQMLPSSGHVIAEPVQMPLLQVSPVVQTLLSLQLAPLTTLAKTQPVAGLQESVVQELPSLQVVAVNTHALLTHVSVVQALVSLQSAFTWQKPGAAEQAKFAQEFPPEKAAPGLMST